MDKLVSVIVPVYNAGQYLEKCLSSISLQTYGNIEIIVVDDGSTDGSGDVIRSFSSADIRFRCVFRENRGVSASRNLGVSMAQGDYLAFVDADDWVEPDYIEKLLRLAVSTGSMLVACNHVIEQRKNSFPRFDISREERFISYRDACEGVLYNEEPDVSPPCKLYDVSLKNVMNYPEGSVFEDTYAMAGILRTAGGIYQSYEPLYHYRFLEGSTSKKTDAEHLWDYMDAVEHLAEAVSADFPEMKKPIATARVHASVSTMRLEVSGNEKPDYSRARAVVRKNIRTVLGDPRSGRRNKLGGLAVCMGPGFFRTCWKVYCRLTGHTQKR